MSAWIDCCLSHRIIELLRLESSFLRTLIFFGIVHENVPGTCIHTCFVILSGFIYCSELSALVCVFVFA